jgi:hypothetical protein
MGLIRMNDDTKPIIACPPVDPALFAKAGIPPWEPREGFIVTNCDLCKQLVWIGPRQAQIRQELACAVECWACAVKQGARSEDIKSLGG